MDGCPEQQFTLPQLSPGEQDGPLAPNGTQTASGQAPLQQRITPPLEVDRPQVCPAFAATQTPFWQLWHCGDGQSADSQHA
jgi:hypothetical protein